MLAFVIYVKIRTVDLDSPGDENEGDRDDIIKTIML